MNKLLILPENNAIRFNPANPEGFPDCTNQKLLPGVEEALNFYKAQGFKIVVCANAGGVAAGVTTIQQKLSEMTVLMTKLAPQIDELLLCPDFKGAFAYWLTRNQDRFPSLRRLRSNQVPNYKTLLAPDDEEAQWEDVEIDPFRKGDAGMLNWVILDSNAQHIVAVWERDEDRRAAESATFYRAQLYLQSARFWRETLNPTGSDRQGPSSPAPPPVSPQPPRTSPTPPVLPQRQRRFQKIDPAQNMSKFWTIHLSPDSLSFEINWGRIGSSGRATPVIKTFPTATQAQREYLDRIQAQLDDGYVEV